MRAFKTWLVATSTLALLAMGACSRPAPTVKVTPDPGELIQSDAPSATPQEPRSETSAAPSSSAAEPVARQASGGGGNCTTTYVGGGYQPGLNGGPGTMTPGTPMTVCSAPTPARFAPVAAPIAARAVPVAARAEPAAPANPN